MRSFPAQDRHDEATLATVHQKFPHERHSVKIERQATVDEKRLVFMNMDFVALVPRIRLGFGQNCSRTRLVLMVQSLPELEFGSLSIT